MTLGSFRLSSEMRSMSRSVKCKHLAVGPKKVELTLIELSLVVSDLLSRTWDPVQAFLFATSHVQIIDAAPRQRWHPELCLVPRLLQPRRYPGQPCLFDKRCMNDLVYVGLVQYVSGAFVVAVTASKLAKYAFPSRIHLISHLASTRTKTRHK